jgi:hypothetical protein
MLQTGSDVERFRVVGGTLLGETKQQQPGLLNLRGLVEVIRQSRTYVQSRLRRIKPKLLVSLVANALEHKNRTRGD